MKSKIIQLSQGEIAYLENCSDGPVVLFIHGNNCAKESFEKQFKDSVLSSYRLMALDLPGHGESSKMEGFYSLKGLASVVVEFAQKLKLDKPILVGHSLGGHVAIQIANDMEISGLVISQTPPLNSVDDMAKGFNPSEALNFLFTPDLTGDQKTILAESLAGDQELQEKVVKWVTCCDPRFRELLGTSIACSSFGEIDILDCLKVPCIYLGSSNDALINQSYVRNILKENLFEIESTAHFPHFEWWHLFNRYLSIFLKEIEEIPDGIIDGRVSSNDSLQF